MSTLAGLPNSESSWKQEVCRRVAARYAQVPSYSQMHTEARAARNAVPEALPGPWEASAEAFLGEFDAVQARTPEQPSTQAWKPDGVPVQPGSFSTTTTSAGTTGSRRLTCAMAENREAAALESCPAYPQ